MQKSPTSFWKVSISRVALDATVLYLGISDNRFHVFLWLRLHTWREGPKQSHEMLGLAWREFPSLVRRLGEHAEI